MACQTITVTSGINGATIRYYLCGDPNYTDTVIDPNTSVYLGCLTYASSSDITVLDGDLVNISSGGNCTPAGPTVTFQGGSVPDVVNSGATYQPAANGFSPGGYLINVLIDKSTDLVNWTAWAHDGFAQTTSHTNTGNPSTDSGTGDTVVYWRVTATDIFGQTAQVIDDVKVNAFPQVSFTSTPPSTVTRGDVGFINAFGTDVDQQSWGYLTALSIDVQVNGGGWSVLTLVNRGDAGFPNAGYT
jgi:hypothetical protein